MATMDISHSPGKATLHRNNATSSRHHHQRSLQSPFESNEIRGRQPTSPTKPSTPPTPGKENKPLLSSDVRYGALAMKQMPTSPGKKSRVRARSVSPSKGFRLRSKPSASDVANEQVQRSVGEIDYEFVRMLSDMQVPNGLMHKLMGLDSRVKESMIKGQATLSLSALQQQSGSAGKQRIPLSERFARSKSSVNLIDLNDDLPALAPPIRSSDHDRQASYASSLQSESSTSSSLSRQRGDRFSQLNNSLHTVRSRPSSFVKEAGTHTTSVTAVQFATFLKANDAAHLDVNKVKQMRAVLAAESPSWLTEFFEEGGFRAMIVRLQELLQMEWREEQHDDQLLHELLRCFIALASTKCGRQTLMSASPTPFVDLCDLLYSEKKPGDLSTRKLLLDMLILLPELPSARQSSQISANRISSGLLTGASGLQSNFDLLLTLLHNQRDPIQEAVVDFITASHTPRPFKMWVTEMLNISRDYFWIFCHASNRFWDLTGVNVDEAQGPKVPGGMTGGVEFEAMSYLTCHFRLVNKVAEQLPSSADSQTSKAYLFHVLLFNSGFERALAVSRKASQTYYQALHLEMARYFMLARKAGFRVPVELDAWQSTPQLLPERGGVRTADAMTAPQLSLDLGNSLSEAKPPAAGRTTGTVSQAVRQWEQRASDQPAERRSFMVEDTAFHWV